MPRGTRKNNKKPAEKNSSGDLPLLQLVNQADERLDIPAMKTWLWDAACKIRGATDAPKYKDFILPLNFNKLLSDVFDDEYEKVDHLDVTQATAVKAIYANFPDYWWMPVRKLI